MAKLIPPTISSLTPSPGEKEVFKKFINDEYTKDWVVFHSLDVARHIVKKFGEIDFLVVIPGKGVMAVEIKAHRFVSRSENGQWFLGKDSTGDNSPFTQVRETMESLRKYVVNKNRYLKKVPFFHMVLFTHTNFEQVSAEWQPWQCVGMRRYRLKGIGRVISDAMKMARQALAETPNARWFKRDDICPNNDQIKLLIDIVRPSFEMFQTPIDRLSEQKTKIIEYTKEQFLALDAMESNDRVLFTGPAGTGKTILALETARRANQMGLKTLFLCYSNRLSKWLATQLSVLDKVEVRTFHSFMLRITNESPVRREKNFWDELLPEMTLEKLLNDVSEEKIFDMLILDEAQDLMHENLLDIMELVLDGGLGSGCWQFYGDFQGQAIFSSNTTSADLRNRLKSRCENFSEYKLSVNCRNRKQTASQAIRIGRFGELYSAYKRENADGSQVRFISYSSENDQLRKVSQAINTLLRQGYPAKQITILSVKRDQQCIANKISKGGLAPVVEYDLAREDHVGYTTIHDFKGMENAMIFITDVEDLESEYARRILYTATTRSTDAFQIFLAPVAQRHLENLLIPG